MKADLDRHLLQERSVPAYVTNDTFILGSRGTEGTSMGVVCGTTNDGSNTPTPTSSTEREDGPSMLILTGPNYSGKSVYLKQVALIVYMAHVGR